MRNSFPAALAVGLLLALGLGFLGRSMVNAVNANRALDRSVTVKGLSEREVNADIAIWPISFNEASNDLERLSTAIQSKNDIILEFLEEEGFTADEISVGAPSVNDLKAQRYGGSQNIEFRYQGSSAITVYTSSVDRVRETMSKMSRLARLGVAVSGDDHGSRPQFLFEGLNELKPEMVEEATRNAREVAEKFAADSGSSLGKIRQASQGLFSINDRDYQTRHIKKVRVVTTVEYYLVD